MAAMTNYHQEGAFLQELELKCQLAVLPRKALGEGPSLLLPASGAAGIFWLVASYNFNLHPHRYMTSSLCVSSVSSLLRTLPLDILPIRRE